MSSRWYYGKLIVKSYFYYVFVTIFFETNIHLNFKFNQLFLGILLLIVGLRECNSISSQEDHKNLLEKANFDKNVDKMDETENLGDRLSPKTRNVNINGGGNIDTF